MSKTQTSDDNPPKVYVDEDGTLVYLNPGQKPKHNWNEITSIRNIDLEVHCGELVYIELSAYAKLHKE